MTYPVSVAFVTLGCPKNDEDSSVMAALIEASSYELVDDVDKADIIVVNTCSFITEATEQSIEVIFNLLEQSSHRTTPAKLIVTGCMPSRYGDDLREELFEVAAFLPAKDEKSLLAVIEKLTGIPCDEQSPLPVLASKSPSAYVKISDGCDRFCSYCTIPFIRGRYHSFSIDSIIAKARIYIEAGAKEIVLIGQDTGIWGYDLEGAPNLAFLLDTLVEAFPHTWIRVMYLQPEALNDELLACFKRHDTVCNYFDIPLQHVAKHVLEDMNRHGSFQEYLDMVNHIREVLEDATLRTTFIAGFPGETRQDAHELELFLEAAQFDYAGVFVYSQEELTVAGKSTNQVPLRTRKARAQRLRDIADKIGFARAELRVGSVVPVLVEDIEHDGEREELIGRTMFMAPEVDGTVHLPLESDIHFGDIIKVKLTSSFCYEYEGEALL